MTSDDLIFQIKKFKDAMAKHGTERCSLGPAKGLEESELMALAANKDLSFTYTRRSEPEPEPVPGLVKEASPPAPPAPKPSFAGAAQDSSEKPVVAAWR